MSTGAILTAVVIGILVGYVFKFRGMGQKLIDLLLLTSLYFLLFTMGLKIGLNKELLSSLPVLGIKSLVLAIAAVSGSVACVLILERTFLYNKRFAVFYSDKAKNSEKEKEKTAHSKLTYKIIIALISGISAGILIPQFQDFAPKLQKFTEIFLIIMVFTSAIGIGANKDALPNLKSSGAGLLVVPIGIVIGSLLGTFIVAKFINMPFAKAMAVGGSMGWYTLGGATLGAIDTQLGVIAFVANLMRELIALICIPIVAKKFGFFAAIAPAGSTSMDISLPVIVKATTESNMIVAFTSGILLSIVTPIILSVLINYF